MALNRDCISKVIEKCDTKETLEAVASAFPSLTQDVERRKSQLDKLWLAWLQAAQAPFRPNRGAEKRRLDEIDSRLGDFCLSDSKTMLFKSSKPGPQELLTGVERKWIHERCGQLRLISRSLDNDRSFSTLKPVEVQKPDGWTMAWKPQPMQERGEKRTKPSRSTQMKRWRRSCEECGAELTVDEAMYSGMGPLCEDCIDDDPELEGMKWEPRSSFW
jgi:hypothetical protein